jgi:hypothetical protein
MHEDLWANVHQKIEEARRAYDQMGTSLRPREGHQRLEAAGAMAEHNWQESFWSAVGSFLVTVRSVPLIIEACFGKDLGHARMKKWFASLTADEQLRRKNFSTEFADDHDRIRKHHLTIERDVTVHRRGFPDARVEVPGPFGQMHTATPTTRIPTTESRPLEPNIGDDPALQWAATQPPRPIRTPPPDQFTVGPDRKPLFSECRAYLELAEQVAEPRVIRSLRIRPMLLSKRTRTVHLQKPRSGAPRRRLFVSALDVRPAHLTQSVVDCPAEADIFLTVEVP